MLDYDISLSLSPVISQQCPGTRQPILKSVSLIIMMICELNPSTPPVPNTNTNIPPPERGREIWISEDIVSERENQGS